MNVLLLVDLQNDFLPGGALAVPHGDAVIPVANRLMPYFDLVVATRDWHPPDHVSFARNHPGCRPGDVIDVDGLPQVLWPVHCVPGTAGAEISDALDRDAIDHYIRKGTNPRIDSYSTFFDNAHRQSTGLDDYLNAHGVSDIYLMGLATDYCVLYSVRDARMLGYAVTVIPDGCRGIDLHPGDVASAYAEMREIGAVLTASEELVRQFGGQGMAA